MTRIVVERQIKASPEIVFQTVSDIKKFSEAVPHITKIEFLSEQQLGLGTRFRETRLMKGREASTELEVAEFVENDRIRMIADSHGTVWDTLFTVEPAADGSVLTMTMDARAHKLLPRLLNPLIKGIVKRAVEDDMDSVKAFCESAATG